MSDNKDIDFDTLPSSSDDLIDDDIDEFEDTEEGEDLSFDDSSDQEYDEEDDDNESDDEYSDENEVDYDDSDEGDDVEPRSSSIIKDVAVYGGGGIVFVGLAAYYLQTVLGISLFGSGEEGSDNNQGQLNEIESRSVDLRGVPSSDIVKARDSTIFDINDGWGENEVVSESDESFDSPFIEDEVRASESMSQGDYPILGLEVDDSETKMILQEVTVQIEGIINDAVQGLLTKSYFEQSISTLGDSISNDVQEHIKSSEIRVGEFIEGVIDSSVVKDIKGGENKADYKNLILNRSRLPNINIIDASANGEMAVVKNSSGGNNVLSVGESFSVEGVSYSVSSVVDNGMLVLVDDKYFIDTIRESRALNDTKTSQEAPSRISDGESNKKSNTERMKAEKAVADSLIRDYKEYRIEYSDHNFSNALKRNDSAVDYVMLQQPPSGVSLHNYGVRDPLQEIPRQDKLIVAEGWKGSMIMGDEFLVVDPSGSWRKLKKGDRVRDFDNNLVHGLDSRNNLIIGNHVVLF